MVLSVSALQTVKETVVCVPVRDVPGLTASVELLASVRKSAVLAVASHVNVLTATVALTVNVVTNVREEPQAAVSVCVRDVMVLPVSVGTSASVLKDAASALNAVSSLPSCQCMYMCVLHVILGYIVVGMVAITSI